MGIATFYLGLCHDLLRKNERIALALYPILFYTIINHKACDLVMLKPVQYEVFHEDRLHPIRPNLR